MRFCNIASGSSGNCTYIGDDNTHLFVDVGISGKRIEAGLNEIGLTTSDMTGILITHEHTDHIGGLPVISKRYSIPIYATRGTIEAIRNIPKFSDIPEGLFHEIKADRVFMIGDFCVRPVKISHDAAEPVGFRLDNKGRSVGVITDLGKYDDYTVNCMKGCNTVMMEANHDVNMLQVGPYPYKLNKSIRGDKGHLSNDACGRFLVDLLSTRLENIILGHLSQENNLAELAYETVRMEVTMSDTGFRFSDLRVLIGKRDERTELLTV
ncbi:MAG: MBL fold metallo-hydrolase [Lachnospiraceae bacterium]|nr:MBL fold metallo-hydrolase [Lachnospiraceae bacterium]